MIKVGIIGGSGLDDPTILKDAKDVDINMTPYGSPSSLLKTGKIHGVEVAILARHGRQHTIPPTEINFRANIYALKLIGCTHILATTAVGSLKEEIKRGDLVVLDQFIDFTRHRHVTFYRSFEPHDPKHTPMAEPFSKELRAVLIQELQKLNYPHHPKGTVVTIEGPRFSTKAESHMFRTFGADVINMSIAPEAILANELNIPYAVIAMSTDYDCWREDEAPVSWDDIIKVFKSNAEKVITLMINALPHIPESQQTSSMPMVQTEKKLEDYIRTIPDFPKKGIQFKDITSLLKDPIAFKSAIKQMADLYRDKKIDMVVGIESRGFVFGAGIAYELNTGFIPARKPGKLPGKTLKKEYQLEYGTDAVEIHRDDIQKGQNVLIVDDLIATGGTIKATAELVEELGGTVVGLCFLIDLVNIRKPGLSLKYPITSLIQFHVDE